MALVEIVSGLATDRAVAETLFATAAAWGKTPVHAKSTPGFIVNRVARPYYAEALRLAQEGAADYATIDAVMREAGGFRMGPFELMDMIGHDVNFAVTNSVWRAFFHDPRFLPSLIQQELVDAGFFGKKTGRGFYDYREGAAQPAPQTEAAQPPAGENDRSSARQPQPRHWPNAWRTAACPLARPPNGDGRIAEIGGAALYVTDGRSATQRAAESGIANTVLIDLALDYAKATRLAVAAAEQCAPAAVAAAIGLLQAAGFAVSRFARRARPGRHAHRRDARQRGRRRGQPGRLHRRRRRLGDAPRRQLPAGASGLGGPGRRRGDPRRARQPRRQPMARIATASRR